MLLSIKKLGLLHQRQSGVRIVCLARGRYLHWILYFILENIFNCLLSTWTPAVSFSVLTCLSHTSWQNTGGQWTNWQLVRLPAATEGCSCPSWGAYWMGPKLTHPTAETHPSHLCSPSHATEETALHGSSVSRENSLHAFKMCWESSLYRTSHHWSLSSACLEKSWLKGNLRVLDPDSWDFVAMFVGNFDSTR